MSDKPIFITAVTKYDGTRGAFLIFQVEVGGRSQTMHLTMEAADQFRKLIPADLLGIVGQISKLETLQKPDEL